MTNSRLLAYNQTLGTNFENIIFIGFVPYPLLMELAE